ncbi:MAG TPA: hypothetical protein VLT84_11490 [Acidobacteriota bacterium]|nr:hypothetical protein [Acidobacteriota bacterium]
MGDHYLRLATQPEGGGVLPSAAQATREDVGYFFINSFLLSRIDSDLPSDLEEYDEDVNVYTASLLAGIVTGREDLLRADLVSARDSDVFARVEATKDRRHRYRVYKANADFLYVSLGLFSGGEATAAVPHDPADRTQALTGRGKSYYHFASAYAERLYGSRAGIAEVMDKLSRNFEAYTKVMAWMSGEYLHLLQRMSAGEVFHLSRDLQSRFEASHKTHVWDELLESYVAWQRTHALEARRRLHRAARELKKIDPSFSFRAFRERWTPRPEE